MRLPSLPELRLHNGTVYRWNRPIYDIVGGTPHLRVENRVLPAGPTLVDVLANAAFYYGVIRMLASDDRPLWTKMSFAAARAELPQRRPRRHRVAALLARVRRGAGRGARAAPPPADGSRRPGRLGRLGGRARPLPVRHRGPLQDHRRTARPGRPTRSTGSRPGVWTARRRWPRCSGSTPSTCTATNRCTPGHCPDTGRRSSRRGALPCRYTLTPLTPPRSSWPRAAGREADRQED